MLYTNCNLCGEILRYSKKKPMWCKKCRPKTQNKKKPKVPHARSKFENKVYKVLNILLPQTEYIDNGYYSWMMSPSGYPLQLDRYYPELELAIEIQGEQHEKFIEVFHKTQESFIYLRLCDKIKIEQCKAREIKLIHIRHDTVITKNNIIELFKTNHVWDKIRRTTFIGGI